MKLLFVSGLYSRSLEEIFKCNSKSHSIQNAPNVFQWAVVDGLMKNNVDFEVVSFPFLASYPKGYRRLFAPSSDVVLNDKVIGKSIHYCDLILYKNYSIKSRLKEYVRNWIERNRQEDHLWVLVYTPLDIFISPLSALKKKYPNVKISSIVTDLPDDALNFSMNRTFLKRIQCGIEKNRQKKLYGSIDKFVLLSDAMKEKIPQAEGKYIVMEGICSSFCSKNKVIEKHSKEKTLIYTGSLHEFAGIKDLVDAFMLTSNPDFRLVICGIGECEDYIKEKSCEDNRIVFKGNVSRSEAIILQTNATVVINPRKPNGGITKYSFPSKTMEYMSSGTPMIGYKLEGIPEEYFEHIYCIDDLSLKGLVDKINAVLSLSQSELNVKAENAANFIMDNKNAARQMKRILDFIR